MTGSRGLREGAVALGVAAIVLVASVWPSPPRILQAVETGSQDLRFRLRGGESPQTAMAVILVDDPSLARLGPWPLDRRLYARAVDALDAAGARLIVFDMLFSEPDRASSAAIRDLARRAATALKGTAQADIAAALDQLAALDPDAELAAAIRRSGRVLLAASVSSDPGGQADLSDAAFQRFDKTDLAPETPLLARSALAPLPDLATASLGLGLVNTASDPDGVSRRFYLALPYDGDYLPGLPVRAAAAALGIPWESVGLALGESIQLGSIMVPTDRGMALRLSAYGPRGTIPTYSFADLLDGRIPKAALAGRIVILGASYVGNADAGASAFGPRPVPGSERIATAVANILDQRFLREPAPPVQLGLLAAILTLAGLAGICTARLPTRTVALAGLLPLASWFAMAQVAFDSGWLIPLAGPELALFAASASALLLRYSVTERDGRRVKAMFKRYLAPAMVDILAAHPERIRLGGETRNLTLMFCDIRGFTTIAEAYQADPQGLTRLINRFLTPMSEIILRHGGTIDKYIGDCIMAFWNAPLDDPDHARRACACALAMRGELAALNERLGAEACLDGRTFQPIRIGIGLNSGDCVVGNMGSESRSDYSVLGDPVNLASRLEGQSKTYGVDIVVGAATRAAAPSHAFVELDLIAVKGKRESVRIFALLGDESLAETEDFQAIAAAQATFLTAYRQGDLDLAREALERCEDLAPDLAALHRVYAARLAARLDTPLPSDWDGVFVASTK